MSNIDTNPKCICIIIAYQIEDIPYVTFDPCLFGIMTTNRLFRKRIWAVAYKRLFNHNPWAIVI